MPLLLPAVPATVLQCSLPVSTYTLHQIAHFTLNHCIIAKVLPCVHTPDLMQYEQTRHSYRNSADQLLWLAFPQAFACICDICICLEEMEGQLVIVLANLKPRTECSLGTAAWQFCASFTEMTTAEHRKLVGFESQGMVMCATSGEGKVEPGPKKRKQTERLEPAQTQDCNARQCTINYTHGFHKRYVRLIRQNI